MRYKREYPGIISNFAAFTEVRGRFLELSGSDVTTESYEVSSSGHEATYPSLDEFLVSRFLPEATGCHMSVHTTTTHLFASGILWHLASVARTKISVDGLTEGQAESLVTHAANSLAISAKGQPKQPPSLAPSVFVGHSFDGPGREVADVITTFLRTLDFEVATGEPFQANRVSDKVKEMIRQHSVVLCIFTKPIDAGKPFSEWVRDEATFAAALDKPLFVLVEMGIGNIPGIHGDLEYVPFDYRNLGPVLLKVLQGLNALGFRFGVTGREPRRGLLQRLLGRRPR